MPPWAQCVEPADSSSLVTTMTRPRFRHSSAAVRPAMPEPTTTTSTSATQPGGSAASRCGSRGRWAGRAAEGQRALRGLAARRGQRVASCGQQGLQRRAPWGTCFRISRCRRQTRGCGSTPGWSRAYGADGFWRRNWPDEHFRTAVATSPLFAEAVTTVADRIGVAAVVDVGAGRGRAADRARRIGDRAPGGRDRPPPAARSAARRGGLGRGPVGRALRAVDHRTGGPPAGRGRPGAGGGGRVAGRPALPGGDPGRRRLAGGRGGAGGEERPGPRLAGADLEWADRWWPAGQRAEIGSDPGPGLGRAGRRGPAPWRRSGAGRLRPRPGAPDRRTARSPRTGTAAGPADAVDAR